jgi:hypothetical protein
MITTAIIFDHRNRTPKGRPGALEVRITVDRKPLYIPTGIKVLSSEWKFGRIVDRPDSAALNERLDVIAQRIESIVTECVKNGTPIDAARIKREAWGENLDDGRAPFLDWADEAVKRMDVAPGTRKHYITTCKRLRAYGRIRRWQDLTSEAILDFDRYLHTLSVNQSDAAKKMCLQDHPISDAAVYNYHKNMKGLIRQALFEGKLTVSPYARLKGKLKRGEKESVEYLTEEEVAAFMSQHPVPGTTMAVTRPSQGQNSTSATRPRLLETPGTRSVIERFTLDGSESVTTKPVGKTMASACSKFVVPRILCRVSSTRCVSAPEEIIRTPASVAIFKSFL